MASVSWISPPSPAPCARVFEDVGREDIPARDPKIRRSVLKGGLLDKPVDRDDVALALAEASTAVVGDLGPLDRDQRDHRLTGRLGNLDHAREGLAPVGE